MHILSGEEKTKGEGYMKQAAEVALSSTCRRSRCGAVIVHEGKVIGKGFNSPPAQDERQRRCENDKGSYDRKVTDKTCCVHAEERATLDALRKHPEKVVGSELYFIRLDVHGEKEFSGIPFCTLCSKLTLDVGVATFSLWHKEGITSYETGEYNQLSFEYRGENN